MNSTNKLKPEIETLLASIFYLMSRYAETQDNEIADAIHMHLNLLETHPNLSSPVLMKTCRRLKCHWVSLSEKIKYENFSYNIQDKRQIH